MIMIYKSPSEEKLNATANKAFIVVRIILEEAVHRVLLGNEDGVWRKGICNLMVLLRNIEALKKDAQQLAITGLFVSMTEDNVRKMHSCILGDIMSLELLPSWGLLSWDFGPMRSELNSLTHITRQQLRRSNTLSFEEGVALSAHAEGRQRQHLPRPGMGWREGRSVFDTDEDI